MTTGYNENLRDEETVNRYGAVPEDDPKGSSGWGTSVTGHDPGRGINTSNPKWTSARLAEPYYYNGPSIDPYNFHSAEQAQRQATMETWSDPMKRATLDQFSRLLQQYGHTNSPGTLWSLAQSGLDHNSDAIQSVLKADAAAYHDDYASAIPAVAQETSLADNLWPDDIWKIPQFFTRNAFAALSMPMEAVQGSWRGVGGALTEEGGPDIGEAIASVASLVPPIAAIIDGSIMADDDFVNPWEQTDFGQTLLYGGTKDWSDAFTVAQAGLDLNAAQDLIETDPAYAEQRQAIMENPGNANTVLTEVAKTAGLYSGPGWFIDETSQVGEAQRQATYNSWAIPGPDGEMTAWTLGRGIVGATQGTDWAGYSFVSGLIDGIAAVATDPTIIGAKFGVVSKSARGIGRLAEMAGKEGAEQALTFGREARNIKKAQALTNQMSQKAVDDYNRLTTVEGNPLYRSDPITLDEWAGYDLEQHAATVRILQEAKAAESAAKAASAPAGILSRKMKDARRHLINWVRGSNAYEEAWEDVPSLARTAQLWQEMADATRVANVGRPADEMLSWGKHPEMGYQSGDWHVFSAGKGKWVVQKAGETRREGLKTLRDAKEYVDELDRADLASGGVYDPKAYWAWWAGLPAEDRALMETSFDYVQSLADRARLPQLRPDGNPTDTLIKAVIDHYDGKVKSGLGKPKPQAVNESRAAGDAVRLALSGQEEVLLPTISTVDTAGTTIAGDFIPGQAHLGKTDSMDSIVYWNGPSDPVIRNAEEALEAINPGMGQRLADFIEEGATLPKMASPSIGLTPAEADTLAESIAQQIDSVGNPFPDIAAMIRNPETTIGQVYGRLTAFGLEGLLDDFLRSEGVDGIRGVNGATRDGVWFGDHPMLETYARQADFDDNLATAAGIADQAEKEAFLDALPAAQQIGLRSMTRSEIERFMDEADAASLKAQEGYVKVGASALDIARAEQVKLDDITRMLDEQFADPEKALKSILAFEAGMTMSAGRGATVSPEAVRWFLFGTGPLASLRARALKVFANFADDADVKKFKNLNPASPEWKAAYDDVAPRYLGELRLATKNKWSSDTYHAILKNALQEGGEDGLIRVLAPRLGVDVNGSDIARSLKLSDKDGLKQIQTMRTSNSAVKRTVARMMSERPGSREIDVDNSEQVVDAIINYATYAKLAPREMQELIGRVTLHDGQFDAVPTNVKVLMDTFDLVGKKLTDNLAQSNLIFRGAAGETRLKELQAAMRDSTRLFLSGHVYKPDLNERMAVGADLVKFMDADGTSVDLPKYLLESELINGKLALPNVDDWAAGLGRIGAAIHRLPATERIYDIGRAIYDNFFRTALLVFRASYIIRNSAEMQIRMFLNGHHSVFSDPTTLVAMVVGGSGGKLRQSFSRYDKTILDTSFNVGEDEAAAWANHVQDYFALTRQANSLTDPRVYRSSIARGWQAVTVDKPQFAAGWANELIMLNRSQISRSVLNDLPKDAVRSGNLDYRVDVVNWIRSDAESAQRVRSQMIAADPSYKNIFESESMTMDYLFENKNSVYARIKQFTMSDPVLEDFVKYGKWVGDGEVETISRKPRLQDRVNILRKALTNRFFDGGTQEAAMRSHMMGESGNGVVVTVPWIDRASMSRGTGFIDAFFQFANRIERLGTVGPEFQLAYWDRVAELAAGIRRSDLDTAMKAAESTLSPLKRMLPDGTVKQIGNNHPAWKALQKAKEENSDGLLTINEIHQIAMKYAADEVKGLFYDAARRNNFWAATRLLFPFGQAWGNTITTWGKLGAKQPIQVYKALKVLNAANEEGSSAIYDTLEGSPIGFGTYAEGMAPWEQDPNGGFFFTNEYGDTSFMTPFVGRAAAVPINMLSALNGVNSNIESLDMESGTQSLNLALGSDSMLPGTSFVVPMILDAMPDSEIIAQAKAIVSPFGQKGALESATPSWLASTIGGLGAVPVIGESLSGFLSSLSPSMKNKNARDAVAILSATGQYDMTDPFSMQKLEQDAANLGSSMLLITGLFKNWMPTSPTPRPGLDLSPDEFTGGKESAGAYAVGMLSRIYPLYLEENGGDEALAKEQMLRDYGPAAIFALTRNKAGYMSLPASDARKWAQSSRTNYEIAQTFPDYFGLFFPKGDATDMVTRLWMEDLVNIDRQNLNPQEIIDANVTWMIRTQRARIDFFEGNDIIDREQADALRDEVKESFKDTNMGQEFNSQSATARVEQINSMYEGGPSLRSSPAARSWEAAWEYRAQALAEARRRQGDESATLGGKGVASIKQAYLEDLDTLLEDNPAFKLLHNVLSKEWD